MNPTQFQGRVSTEQESAGPSDENCGLFGFQGTIVRPWRFGLVILSSPMSLTVDSY